MNGSSGHNLPPILPVGTAVVTRVVVRGADHEVLRPAGSVGVIVSAPMDLDHPYRIRFADGKEVTLSRPEMYVLRHFQHPDQGDQADAMVEHDLYQHVIYRCVIGSRAYGLEHDASDYDRRGIYLPPASLHWSMIGVPEQLENQATQDCYWELQKFLTLALRANPNVLEVLYSPLVEHAAPAAQELLDMRQVFLSKLVYQTYNGYVLSQFKKLEADMRNHGQVKWKHAMHLIRLLLAGITVLREAYVPVRVIEHRDRLMTIRRGQMPWDQVDAWRLELHRQFDEAYAKTALPDRPDYLVVDEFLIRTRRSMVQ